MTVYQFKLSTTAVANQVELIRVRQDDDESQIFRATIFEDGKVKNLNGVSAEFNMVDAQHYIVVDDARIVDATNGIVEYQLRKEAMLSVGRCNAYFSFKSNKEVVYSTKDFNYNVIWSALSSPMHQGCDYVWTASDLIDSLKDWIEHAMGDFDDWFESVKEILASIDPGGVILNELLELKKKMAEIELKENTLDLKNSEVFFYSDLGLASNTIPGCFAIDDQRDYIYTYQSSTDIPTVTRTNSNGVYLDKMDIPNGKDMKSLGCDFAQGVANLWVEVGADLVRFTYTPGGNLDTSVNKTKITFDGSVNRKRFGVSIDNYQGVVSCIVDEMIVVYSLKDIGQQPIKSIKIDSDIMSSLCGFHYFDNKAFVLSSENSVRNPTYITTYTEDGRVINYKIDIFGDIEEEHYSTVRYPNGIQLLKNRTTNKLSLVFSVTRGRIGFRETQLFALHQKGNDIKRLFNLAQFGQNYRMMSSSGRSQLISEGTTELKKITRPGYYYITVDLAAKLKDIPMHTGKHGYFLEVQPTNNWGVFIQTLKRNAQGTTVMTFERVINPSSNIIGEWNLSQGRMPNKISYWDETTKVLSSVRYPIEYYITSTEFNKLTDIPTEFKTGAGYWIEISTLGTNNAVVQTITKNGLSGFFQAKRVVSDEKVGEFKVL